MLLNILYAGPTLGRVKLAIKGIRVGAETWYKNTIFKASNLAGGREILRGRRETSRKRENLWRKKGETLEERKEKFSEKNTEILERGRELNKCGKLRGYLPPHIYRNYF